MGHPVLDGEIKGYSVTRECGGEELALEFFFLLFLIYLLMINKRDSMIGSGTEAERKQVAAKFEGDQPKPNPSAAPTAQPCKQLIEHL